MLVLRFTRLEIGLGALVLGLTAPFVALLAVVSERGRAAAWIALLLSLAFPVALWIWLSNLSADAL